MGLKNQIEEYRRNSRYLMMVVAVMAIVVAVLGYGVMRLSDVRRIYIPPSFRVGAVLDGRTIPSETVFAFAITTWQQLHRWRDDGEKNYLANIQSLEPFLTPQFRKWLVKDVRERKSVSSGQVNELRGRERSVSLPEGFVYDETMVTLLDDGTWLVTLELELTERFDDLTVKDILIRYPLHIKRYEVSWKSNPWGLAIAGFGGDGPLRLEPESVSMTEIGQ